MDKELEKKLNTLEALIRSLSDRVEAIEYANNMNLDEEDDEKIIFPAINKNHLNEEFTFKEVN